MIEVSSNDLMQIFSFNPIIIDVRLKVDFNKKHIPNSYNIPYDFLLTSCLEYLSKDKTYYIICDNGSLSKKASSYLHHKGFKVINVYDGITKWTGPLIN